MQIRRFKEASHTVREIIEQLAVTRTSWLPWCKEERNSDMPEPKRAVKVSGFDIKLHCPLQDSDGLLIYLLGVPVQAYYNSLPL